MRYNRFNKNRESKYKAKKTIVNDIVFDSRKEAKRYGELVLLQQAGEITDLELQKEFVLIPNQREATTETYTKGEHKGELKQGKLIERKCSYLADFTYKDKEGNLVVEDTKGMRLSDYVIKRKLMLYLHGIRIKEI